MHGVAGPPHTTTPPPHTPSVQTLLQQASSRVHSAPSGEQLSSLQTPSAEQILLQHSMSVVHGACPALHSTPPHVFLPFFSWQRPAPRQQSASASHGTPRGRQHRPVVLSQSANPLKN